MKNNSILLSGIMILFCVAISFAQRGYVKIADINGESTDRAHKDWIIIESFGQGIAPQQAMTSATRRRGTVVFADLIIKKKLDKSTPKLMELCAKGKAIPKLEMEMLSNDGRLYYKVTLNKVKIKSISTSTICDPDCKLIDEVAFSYSEIKWEYWDREGKKTKSSYNLQKGN